MPAAPEPHALPHDPASLDKRTRDTLERMAAAFEAVDALLFRLAEQGLQRLTRSSLQELQAVGQTAHNAKLVRVERELEVLAQQGRRYLDRDPAFRVGAWSASANRIGQLVAAARRAWRAGQLPGEMAPIVGVARRRYEPVDAAVDAHPLGASGWASDTGYVGITTWFHAPSLGRVVQASLARPSQFFGTDPRRLLFQPVSDASMLTMQELSHGAWRLEHVRLSSDGRISLHQELDAAPAPPLGAAAYQGLAVRGWTELVRRIGAEELDPVGGSESVLVYLEPAGIGPLVIDEKRARGVLDLRDTRGAPLWVTVPLTEATDLLIDNLQVLGRQPWRPDGLFGRARVAGGELRFTPYTAIYHQEVRLKLRRRALDVHQVHLALEPLSQVQR